MKKIAILSLGQEFYGLDIEYVSTIKEYSKPSKVPNQQPFVDGVINLRGEIIPVLDLRKILKYPEYDGEFKRETVILENGETLVGLTIDKVLSVSTIDESQIESIDKLNIGDFSEIIQSIAKYEDKLISILDINKILNL